jgi:hypothetical protein
MKVTPICFSATAREKMPCFNKLAAAFAHVDSTSWFIVFRPPIKALCPLKRLPTGPDSKAKRKGRPVKNVRFLWHRDWQLPKNFGVLEVPTSQAVKDHRHVHKFPANNTQSIHFYAHELHNTDPHSIEATEGVGSQAPLAVT